MKPTLYILCGAPGCGKSTFAKQFNSDFVKWISRDEIRFQFIKSDEDYFSHEREVFRHYSKLIADTLAEGKNVLADATQLNTASRKKLTTAIDLNFTEYSIVYVIFTASAETCIKHNKNREGRALVPEDIIHRMRASLTIPNHEDKREIGIITIDGELEI